MKKLIKESLTKKDTKDQVINYSSIIEDAWSPLISEAKDRQGISFDLENNECVGKRVFRKNNELRIGQHVTSIIPIEMWEAGGDWEWPLIYFRVCIESDHFLVSNKYQKDPKYPWDYERDREKYKSGLGHRCFVIIPPVSAGNKYTECKECKEKKYSAWQEEFPDFDKEKVKITDKDKSNLWKWIDKYLSDAIQERYERIDLEANPLGSHIKDNIPPGVTPADPKDAVDHNSPEWDKRSGRGEITAMEPKENQGPTLVKEELSPAAAVYGFAGWLTGRKNPVTLSGHHDAAIAAEMVGAFLDKNNLPDPEGHWERELEMPEENEYDLPSEKIVSESLNENQEREESYKDIEKKIQNSKKLPKEMKEEIIKRIIKSKYGTRYGKKGVVTDLKGSPGKGCSLGADKDGWFVFTHRARSKSKPSIDKIPKKDIKFIESTG